MTLDGITLAAAVRELQFVEGAKIEKIQKVLDIDKQS